MRILIVGAGATGGAFGTLLQEAGRDVTYLVHAGRADALRRDGLRFISTSGDRTNPVQTLIAGEPADPFDLVLVTVKATAIDSAIADVSPYVGADTAVLPFLNGLAHVDRLEQAFPGQVVGGLVKIVATRDGEAVRQLTPLTVLTIGAFDDEELADEIAEALDAPGIQFAVSPDITGALYEKWAFIATAGVVTCLFRGAVGDIIAAGGLPFIEEAIAEIERVVAAAGHPVSDAAHAQAVALLTEESSAFTSSLYRDLIAGLPHEGEHILGDMQKRARELSVATPLLDLAVVQIRTDAARSRGSQRS